MPLKGTYETEADIPEAHKELFTERAGKWEMTEVEGIKTAGDVMRVQTALESERTAHKDTKTKLTVWGEMDHAETMTALDRIPGLEAAAGGNLDEAALEEMARKRADGIVHAKVAPLERQISTLERSAAEFTARNLELEGAAITRSREDLLRPLLLARKVLPEHYEDVFLYADRHLDRGEDGSFSVRQGMGDLTAGATPADWVDEMLAKRPGWIPGTHGANSRGGGGAGGFGGSNPWSGEKWSMTDQANFYREHGAEKANKAAKAAGTHVGGPRPQAKK